MLLVEMVVRSLILSEEHVLQILQQSFKNWKKRIDKEKLMRPRQELQRRQQWKAVLGKPREMVQPKASHLLWSSLGREQSLIDHLLGSHKLPAPALVVVGATGEIEKEAVVIVAVDLVVVVRENVEVVVSLVGCLIIGKVTVDEEEEAGVVVAVVVASGVKKLKKMLLLLHHLLVLSQLLVRMLCPKRKFPTPLTCLVMSN